MCIYIYIYPIQMKKRNTSKDKRIVICAQLSIRRTYTKTQLTSPLHPELPLQNVMLNPNNQNGSSVPSAPDSQTVSKPRKSIEYLLWVPMIIVEIQLLNKNPWQSSGVSKQSPLYSPPPAAQSQPGCPRRAAGASPAPEAAALSCLPTPYSNFIKSHLGLGFVV